MPGSVTKPETGSRRIRRRGDQAGAELDGGDVAFAGGPQAHDEAQAAIRTPAWSGCGTMDGLNRAADSRAYSPVNSAPMSSLRARERGAGEHVGRDPLEVGQQDRFQVEVAAVEVRRDWPPARASASASAQGQGPADDGGDALGHWRK